MGSPILRDTGCTIISLRLIFNLILPLPSAKWPHFGHHHQSPAVLLLYTWTGANFLSNSFRSTDRNGIGACSWKHLVRCMHFGRFYTVLANNRPSAKVSETSFFYKNAYPFTILQILLVENGLASTKHALLSTRDYLARLHEFDN